MIRLALPHHSFLYQKSFQNQFVSGSQCYVSLLQNYCKLVSHSFGLGSVDVTWSNNNFLSFHSLARVSGCSVPVPHFSIDQNPIHDHEPAAFMKYAFLRRTYIRSSTHITHRSRVPSVLRSFQDLFSACREAENTDSQ